MMDLFSYEATRKEHKQEIFDAVLKNDIATINDFIFKGHSLNLVDNRGASLLHYAVRANAYTMVIKLLDGGINKNITDKYGETAFHLAAFIGHYDICEALVKSGADLNLPSKTGMTPLLKAAEKGSLDIVELLIEQGASLNDQDEQGRSVIHFAIMSRNNNFLKQLMSYPIIINHVDCKGNDSVFYAFRYGNKETLNILRTHKVDFYTSNFFYESPLHEVSKMPFNTLGAVCINEGYLMTQESMYSKTPLIHASESNHYELLSYYETHTLSKKEEDIPLFLSIKTKSFDHIVEQCNESTVRFQDLHNRFPLYYALMTNDVHIVKVLLEAGASTININEFHHDAIYYAVIRNQKEMIKILLKYPYDEEKEYHGHDILSLAKQLYPELAKLFLF
jgi:ankyrin repeat protein